MIFPDPGDFTPEQDAAWADLLRELAELEGRADPYVFHGTDHVAAVRILHEGFVDDGARAIGRPGHVYWARLEHAADHAFHGRNRRADSPPSLLMAPLSTVLASGPVEVDPNYVQADTDGPDAHD